MLKFTSDVGYPEDFRVGDIIEVDDMLYYGAVLDVSKDGVKINLDIDPGEEVTVYRHTSAKDVSGAMKFHEYYVHKTLANKALENLPNGIVKSSRIYTYEWFFVDGKEYLALEKNDDGTRTVINDEDDSIIKNFVIPPFVEVSGALALIKDEYHYS